MLNKIDYWITVLLTIAGSAVKATANPVEISSPDGKLENNYQKIVSDRRIVSQLPNPIPPRTPRQPLKLPSEIKKPPLETPPLPSQPPPSVDIPGKVKIKGFKFIGNTAFSEEELNQVVAKFTQKEISFAELLQVEELIRQQYLAGCQSNNVNSNRPCYLNSDVVIAAGQKVDGEIITIEIIEGAIKDIQVTGTKRLNPNYVRSRLALATKKPFDLNRLVAALQLLQLDPLIAEFNAELSTGIRPELSLLKINIKEADSFTVIPAIDNGRNPSVGSFRRSVGLTEANLLGFGDRINLSYSNTDGSDSLDLSYSFPVNARNGTIQINGGFSDTEVIESPFDRLNITGDYRYLELSLRQPLWQSPTEEFALGLTASRQASDSFLDNQGFNLSPGANEDGEVRISAMRFFQDWTKRNPQQVWSIRSQFSLGVQALDATENPSTIPDSSFFAWRGQGQYVQLLAPETLFVVRSDLQLATEPLLALEQFSLGGLNSVRGYRQDLLLTDNAWFLSAEARLPIWQIPQISGVLQIVPFIDLGIGWNNGDFPDPDPNLLVSPGLGLQWQMEERLNARFYWGIPLVDVEIEKRTLSDRGIYFSLDYAF
ncbi:MAG: ShlB/FhaC/HecB family hemolysin secretion/activation protein [Waterburya sp.]